MLFFVLVTLVFVFLDPPRLSSGDNMTKLYEFETGAPILLNTSILMANPPIDSFNITYDATNTTGINTTV